MPEIWIPFGSVETLVTLQAENLGTVEAPEPEKGTLDLERLSELVRSSSKLFICDSAPATFELIKQLAPTMSASGTPKLYSPAPRKAESAVPELKGRISTLPPPVQQEGSEGTAASPQLTEPGAKVLVGTARPDPLFGIADPKVEACLNWVAGSRAASAKANQGMEPTPFAKTSAYDAIESLADGLQECTFLSVIPRGGRVRSVLEKAPFDAVKNGFLETQMQPGRGLIVGPGGAGYDDTFSAALRSIWGVLHGARRGGSVLVVAECSEGLGSPALELLATGRLTGEGGRRKEKYVDGLEEVFYLNKLKEEYEVLMLSGLPETYARNKLGITTARGSGEAVGRLLNRVGRTGKVNVVTRASECRAVSA